MDKQALLSQFTLRLNEAVSARDWKALARADRELATAMGHWSAADLGPEERSGLRLLRSAHDQAVDLCSDELLHLGQLLRQMALHRGRWHAYAESTRWVETLGADT